MLFNSYEFIFLFFPITAILFFKLGQHNKQNALCWLLLASLTFYAFWNISYVPLVLISSLFNYGLAAISNNLRSQKDFTKIQPISQFLLILGIACNLLFLGYFKYGHFIVENLSFLLHQNWKTPSSELPLGISFYTFLQIAYLVDCYREKSHERSFPKYLLFVTFFPHLVAGPIVHHRSLLSQFSKKEIYTFNSDNFAVGISIFILGLSKKVLLADTIANYASPVFDAASQGVTLHLWESWVGALAYTLQLYFDFSGYSDMAIGLARMLNIQLPINFNSPYKAVNIIEFWRRWHITLSNFLRDYLYIPLGGNRKGSRRRYLNLLITMFLGGLWHGAGWTFIFWGGLHGCYLVINQLWRTFRVQTLKQNLNQSHPIGRTTSTLITFVLVVVGWVFFRSKDFASALSLLKGMSGWNGVCLPETTLSSCGEWLHSFGLLEGSLWIIVLLMGVWCLPNTQQMMGHWMNPEQALGQKVELIQFSLRKTWAISLAVLMTLCLVRLSQASEFLYFDF